MRERLGVALFVLGATFLWIVPPFAGSLDRSTALAHSVHVLGVVTIVAFAAAAWGLARCAWWWLVGVRVAAVLGLVTCGVVAALDVAVWHDVLLGLDVLAHAVGSLALLALATVRGWRAGLGDRLRALERRRGSWYLD